MRKIIWAARHLRPALWKGNIGSTKRFDFCSVYINQRVCECKHPLYVVSRALSANAATGVVELSRDGPLMEYGRRIAAGELLDGDASQLDTLGELQRLYDDLVANAGASRLDAYAASQRSARRSWWYSPRFTPVRGLYLYGGVGTGKTMLMDLFYHQLPRSWRKRRIHFHDFMLNVHARLQKHRGVADPLEIVGGEISNESILLCLDEFMVTDVADALILNRLFTHLFNNGVVLVATSNRAPDKLYEGGLQRDLFLPFIATLKERCVVHQIGSYLDYRKMTSAEEGFYFVGKHASKVLEQKFRELIGENVAAPEEVEVVMGRKLQVPLGANGCAYFPFDQLCDRPLGAADYFGLFKKFHTLAVEGVPIFGPANRTAAYRFVTLIDVMYENRARLLCSAEGSPMELFEKVVTISDAATTRGLSDVCVDNDLGFAKDRTISRLTEMNSREYLEQHHHLHPNCN
ncbi:AFG1-like ATPase isoform X1 [Salvia hispanica]|uniref:AFG1-like ATPase isoform X1 n=1 Tax=Salvia hispanica TaxID=49212 RepID=UPI002008FC9C|nr:AFG1-like ATPase isoform X1 [Salvia hispanica]XP_047949800.1 AFG1-like ATPase isoform X1 [Salvia hispanica]